MNLLDQLAIQIELHSLQGIEDCFAKGIDPNDLYKGKPLVDELISEYTRSPRFKDCIKLFVTYGLKMDDPSLLAVLCNDAGALLACSKQYPGSLTKKYSFKCAYTPMQEVSLLHICAEFNHVACAEVLVTNGADINAPAGTDEHEFGAQTPVFHTVNQNGNQSLEMLHFLLDHGADTNYTIRGLTWGKGYSWETFIPAVNPLSYAMMGLLPQMHREPKVIAGIVSLLLEKTYGIHYTLPNIPNAYLNQ